MANKPPPSSHSHFVVNRINGEAPYSITENEKRRRWSCTPLKPLNNRVALFVCSGLLLGLLLLYDGQVSVKSNATMRQKIILKSEGALVTDYNETLSTSVLFNQTPELISTRLMTGVPVQIVTNPPSMSSNSRNKSNNEATINKSLPSLIKIANTNHSISDRKNTTNKKKGKEVPKIIQNTDECFRLNSKAWLQGHRLGNSNVPDEWLDQIMKPHRLLHQPNLDTIMNQTICYKSGQFRNISYLWNASDPSQIRAWGFRLLYLAIHRLHHMAAYPEYQLRRKCGSVATSAGRHLPYAPPNNFDYECPKAKFLIASLPGVGMGSVFRNAVVPTMVMAFASGRIPLFFQSVRGGRGTIPKSFEVKFNLASCDRGDLQCVFLPTSPCVLTMDDLRNATRLTGIESKELKHQAYLKKVHSDTRVLVSSTSLIPMTETFPSHSKARKKLHGVMMELLNDWKRESNNSTMISKEQWNVLSNAAASFLDAGTNHFNTHQIMRAALVYAIMPNRKAQEEIAKQLMHTMQPITLKNNTYISRQYYGLPIRGSDKCQRESTCLSFDRYMELMLMKWQHHQKPGQRGTILLTSEDVTVLPKRLLYAQNSSFPMDFVVNDRDVQPDSGLPAKFRNKADAVMMSTLTVLKLQLQSNAVLVGNCCSNFHSLLFDLVRGGCGVDPELVVECLDRVKDTRFRICCGWHKDSTCNEIRKTITSAK